MTGGMRRGRSAGLRFGGAFPDQPVLTTQTANDRWMRLTVKLGSTEADRFEAYGAEQWFGAWSSTTPSG